MITSTIIASLLGLIGSTLPQLFGWLQAKQKSKDLALMQAHEIAMFQAQTERFGKEAEIKLKQIDAEYAGQANVEVYRFANPTTGWTAKLAEFIRPFITLVFMGLFCAKALSLLSFTFGLNFSGQGMMAGLDAFVKATNAVWDDRTHELFVTIIVFWFGDRGMRRATGK